MGNLYIGLVHWPILNREGRILASALTGIDLHDIARSARTFDVKRYYVITPLKSQQEIAHRIQRYWLDLKEEDTTHRAEALHQAEIVATLDDSLTHVLNIEGQRPLIVATSARSLHKERVTFDRLRAQIEGEDRPVYLVFGTGWGLASEVVQRVDAVLPPIYGPGEYNHLSVRAAAAIILYRLRGRSE
ncbi:RNA methyltransferase [Candidatus Acetothermia bacterium]|nr:RNA methyltransferase [Candidatus Acetothermia bacterium]MBI3643070.1 RNA methyltransferase [Candidatus Acetothermia bacterium]